MLMLVLTAVIISSVSAEDGKKLPENFFVGFRSSSYQVEGGFFSDGKGLSDWDVVTNPRSKINPAFDHATGQIAADSYHKIKEDVKALKDLNAEVYSFSLSWSRILPDGLVGNVNQPGINYYNQLIDELLAKGIEPIVTLFYWDTPLPLIKFGAWANPVVSDYFTEYADLVFRKFGDRVKTWITFAKPAIYCIAGYGYAGILSPMVNMPGVAEYHCAHNILLAHAEIYHLYTEKYKQKVNGKIGISMEVPWFEPMQKDKEHEKSARIMHDFTVGWFAHPIYSKEGGYPKVMIDQIAEESVLEGRPKSRLPVMNEETKEFIKGTYDFFGLSHFAMLFVEPLNHVTTTPPEWVLDAKTNVLPDTKNPKTRLGQITITPWAFRNVLNLIKEEYNNVTIIVTENGMADNDTLNDTYRINYHKGYMNEMLRAIYEDGCNVLGYIVYSLMDEFEWIFGYQFRAGVYRVDFNDTKRERIPKDSVAFFSEMLSTRIVPADKE